MITVVIVTYNSEKDIQGCLRGLFRQGMDVSAVVVDNASHDATLAKLQEFSGYDLMVIKNEENVGFSKAVNLGVGKFSELSNFQNRKEKQYTINDKGEEGIIDNEQWRMGEENYILLLNPDAEMEEGALVSMLKTMELHEKAAIVQPLITLMRKPDRVNTSGNRYRGFGLVTISDFGEAASGFTEDLQIEYASGACMLIRRDVFEELGGMDERFFLYFEDTEFSQRVRWSGYEIWLSAQARVRHDHFFPFRMSKGWNFMKSWVKFLKK
jgi:N-acetylglucosaminyl-diphospho-decaprenol L-rhamnosyltransferase